MLPGSQRLARGACHASVLEKVGLAPEIAPNLASETLELKAPKAGDRYAGELGNGNEKFASRRRWVHAYVDA